MRFRHVCGEKAMSTMQASDARWTETAASRPAVGRKLPVWVRLVLAISAMLVVTWSLMI
jgi:hypothetical protein